MLALLAVSAWDATYKTSGVAPVLRVAIGGGFLLYAVYGLWLFKTPTGNRSAGDRSTPGPSFLLGLAIRITYHLVFRIGFALSAVAYIAQALAIYDPSMLKGNPTNGFVSFLLTILDHTFPPLSALLQFVWVDLEPASLNYTNKLSLLVRLISYLMASFVVLSVIKHIFTSVSQGRFAQLDDNVRLVVRRRWFFRRSRR